MTREELQADFHDKEGMFWLNSQGEPDIDYVMWLEDKILSLPPAEGAEHCETCGTCKWQYAKYEYKCEDCRGGKGNYERDHPTAEGAEADVFFKARRLDTGDWVTGFFTNKKIGNLICPVIEVYKEWDSGDYIESYEIDGKTLVSLHAQRIADKIVKDMNRGWSDLDDDDRDTDDD